MRILLIAHKFPPYPYVGAHRWAKLAKYMARQGTDIEVLTLDWGEETAAAMADVSDPRISITRLPSLAPHKMLAYRTGDTLGGRLLDRVAGAARHVDWLGLTDEPRWWGATLLPAARRRLESGDIDVLVATGAPFLTNYWAARAKRRSPDVPLVQEFRDLWVDRFEAIGVAPRELQRARTREAVALGAADAFVTVTDTWGRAIERRYPDLPVHVIRNGFDPEEYGPAQPSGQDRLVMVHAGRAFAGRERPLRTLLQALRSLGTGLPELEFISYGGFPASVRSEFADLEASGRVAVNATVPPHQVAGILADSVVCVQLNAEKPEGALSTKIYEYAAAGRPTLSVNYGGEIAQLMDDHLLGWNADATDAGKVAARLREIHAMWRQGALATWSPSDMGEFGFDRIAQRYLEMLSGLGNRP